MPEKIGQYTVVIPTNKYHRFMLMGSKKIRCARLFLNHKGWTPLYRDAAVAAAQ